MTRVQQVGVFPTVAVMESGRRLDLMILPMTEQIKVYRSISVLRQLLGILVRVFAAAMASSSMSVASVLIGLHLLSAVIANARTACASTAMAASDRADTANARRVYQSVVSENQNNLISVTGNPA